MPSMHWMGVRWHLSTDALALAGAVLLAVNAAWLAAYAAVIAALGRPQPCEARGEHRAAVWGLLGFLALNVVAAAGMVWVGMQGALVWWHVVRAACCLVLCRRGRGCIFSAYVGVPAHIPCRPPLQAPLCSPASGGGWGPSCTSRRQSGWPAWATSPSASRRCTPCPTPAGRASGAALWRRCCGAPSPSLRRWGAAQRRNLLLHEAARAGRKPAAGCRGALLPSSARGGREA